jgi:hypothetical protein
MPRRRSTRRHPHPQPPRRRFRLRQAVLLMLLVLPALTYSASPQSSTSRAQTNVPTLPVKPGRVLVDGKDNPELINHDLLVAQVVGRMAIPASASPKDEQRVHLFAVVIGLGKDDERILRTEMIRLHAAITPIQARLRATTDRVPIADLQTYREARLQSYGRLLELLSSDGRRKLNEFIEKEKRNTKVFITESQPQ